jgi:hypothetical protein
LEGLRQALLELSGGEMTQLLFQDDILQMVTPVVATVTNIRATRKAVDPATQ